MNAITHDKKYKQLSLGQILAIEKEIKMMLHASRDCLRNKKVDTIKIPFDVSDGYQGEAFGVMRGLQVLGYGYFGAVNRPHEVHSNWNLKWWFAEIEQQVLAEENWNGSHECEHCFAKYGKDDVRHK